MILMGSDSDITHSNKIMQHMKFNNITPGTKIRIPSTPDNAYAQRSEDTTYMAGDEDTSPSVD